MKRIEIGIIMLMLASFLKIGKSWASFEQNGWGGRAKGMGDAYIGLAEGSEALYYNPAGLGMITRKYINSGYSKLYWGLDDGSQLEYMIVDFVYPLIIEKRRKDGYKEIERITHQGTFGLGLSDFSLNDLYREDRLTLSYGREVGKGIYIGMNLKGLDKGYKKEDYLKEDPVFENGYTKSGLGIDLGLLSFVSPRFSIGLSIQDINRPDMGLKDESRVNRKIRGGIAYRRDLYNLCSDVEYENEEELNVHIGGERWFFGKKIGLRGGMNMGGNGRKEISLGGSYWQRGGSKINYAFNYPLGGVVSDYGTHWLTLSIGLGKDLGERIGEERERVLSRTFKVGLAGGKIDKNPPGGMIYLKMVKEFKKERFREVVRLGRILLEDYPQSIYILNGWYLIAESLFREGRYEEARREYEKVYRRYKKDKLASTFVYRICECDYNMGTPGLAAKKLDEFLERYPKSYLKGEVLYGMGNCYLREEKRDLAKECFERLIDEFPGYGEGGKLKFNLGLILWQKGEKKKALEVLEGTDNEGAMYYEAKVRQEIGEDIKSLAIYKNFLKKYPKSALKEKVIYNLGEVLYKLKEYGSSVEKFREYLTEYPLGEDRGWAKYMVGLNYYQMGKYQEAIEVLREVVEEKPLDEIVALSQYVMGSSFMSLRKGKEARIFYQKAAKTSKVEISGEANYKLALSYFKEGKYSRCRQQCKKIIKADISTKMNGQSLLLMGLAYQKGGKIRDAIASYQGIIDEIPDSEIAEEALWRLGSCFYHNKRDYRSLITNYYHLVKSLKFNDSILRGKSYLFIAEGYYETGKYQEARELYQYIINHYGNPHVSLMAKLGRANCDCKLSKFDLALSEQKEILNQAINMGNEQIETLAKLQIANIHLSKKKYKESLARYNDFIKEGAGRYLGLALLRKGESLYRLGYYSEAIRTWKRIKGKEVLEKIGSTYFGLGRYREAIQAYTKLIREYPNSKCIPEAKLHIAESHYNRREYLKAIKRYKEYIREYPDSSQKERAEKGMELAYYHHYQKERDEEGLKRFLRKYPSSELIGDIYWQLGVKAYEDRDYNIASENFRKVVTDYPNSGSVKEAIYYLADSYDRLNKKEEAMRRYKDFLANFPQHPLAKKCEFNLANILFEKGEVKESIGLYDKIIEKYGDSEYGPRAYLNKALAEEKMDKYLEAIQTYKEFIREYRSHEAVDLANFQIAMLSQKLEKYSQAVTYYRKVKKTSLEITYQLGYCLELGRKVKQAIREYEKLRKSEELGSPYRLSGLVRLAKLYEKRGKRGKALEVYNEIIRSTSDEEWIKPAKMEITRLKKRR